MTGQTRGVFQLGALLGVYMAMWIYSEAHVASALGISKDDGILAGILVSLTVWVRLQGSIRVSRRFRNVGASRMIIIVSPLLIYILFTLIFYINNNIIKIFSFILFTLYLGILLAIASSKIYREVDPIHWNTSIFMFKSITILFQIITLIYLKLSIIIDYNYKLILLFIFLIILSVSSAAYIYGSVISSIAYKLFDLIYASLINPSSIKIITDRDINRISSLLAGVFVLKIITLPAATKDDPLLVLLLYALAYFAGTKLASHYFNNIKLIYIISIFSFFMIINTQPIYALLIIGFTIGFLEVSIILLILNYKPRDVIKSNLVPSIWIIFGSLVVGVVSDVSPKYTPYSVFMIITLGYMIRDNTNRW